MLAGVPGVAGMEPLAMYPLGQSAQKLTLLWRKLSELSENVKLDSELVLVFEIWPFKVGFFAFLKKDNFSKDSRV